MSRRHKFLSIAAVAASFFIQVRAENLRVYAAASLADVMTDVAKHYQTFSGEHIIFSFAGSSTLARQIKEGAPADVFLSADLAKVNQLGESHLLGDFPICKFASNTLVFVVESKSTRVISSAADLAAQEIRRIAIAEPETVPAGIYTKQYLLKCALWDKLSPKIVSMENVRAALAVVEQGNADVAIVYHTDALISDKVRVAFAVPREDGPEIIYVGAVTKSARDSTGAARFLNYLKSADARAEFSRYGFLPVR